MTNGTHYLASVVRTTTRGRTEYLFKLKYSSFPLSKFCYKINVKLSLGNLPQIRLLEDYCLYCLAFGQPCKDDFVDILNERSINEASYHSLSKYFLSTNNYFDLDSSFQRARNILSRSRSDRSAPMRAQDIR